MATETVNNGLFRPELWSKLLNKLAFDDGVMLDCVNTKYQGEIKNQGDKVHIQTAGKVTVGTYVEGTDIDYQTLSGDTQELEVDQSKYWAFKVADIAKVQANVDFMTEYMQNAKMELVNTKDAFLLGKSADVPAANQLGDIALTKDNVYSNLVKLRTTLRKNNAISASNKDRTGKSPWLVVDPDTFGIMLNAPEAIHPTNFGDQAVRKGTLLHIAGFDVKESTVLKPVANKVTILAGVTEAITFAEQITKTESLRAEGSFNDLVRGLYLYGAKTVNPTYLASLVNDIS